MVNKDVFNRVIDLLPSEDSRYWDGTRDGTFAIREMEDKGGGRRWMLKTFDFGFIIGFKFPFIFRLWKRLSDK